MAEVRRQRLCHGRSRRLSVETRLRSCCRWLAREAGDGGDPIAAQLKRNAAWATFLMVPPPGTPEAAAVSVRHGCGRHQAS